MKLPRIHFTLCLRQIHLLFANKSIFKSIFILIKLVLISIDSSRELKVLTMGLSIIYRKHKKLPGLECPGDEVAAFSLPLTPLCSKLPETSSPVDY